ncbi:hypothetical protein E6O75_ATG08186 [Venturia nashicola]|uniref:Uncharacterized protein n=1 Tax=Venturia nashicola TaxID=86259 RepID=A0A4Z1P155_9PEZI|nr:hypothetical protein E6O75_ATG08186 [Venturia nashicola]
MEYRRLLERAKNDTVHGTSRRAFESALKRLSENATNTIWHDSHQHANLNTFCAVIMSDVVSTNDVDLIKVALVSLATWLVPKSISTVASACQNSTIIGNQHELSSGCQIIHALIDGLKAQVPETFIEEELVKLFRNSDVLYASDAPELLWILRRKSNRQANQIAVLRLIQKNVRNSSFLAEFLNSLYQSRDFATKATTQMFFFKRLLPVFSFTYSFLPHKQPLRCTDNSFSCPENDGEPENNSLQEEEQLFDEWKKEWEDLEEDSMPEALAFSPTIEVHEGQRCFDEALGGKELALLIQAASQLGFTAEIKQILGLAMIKLEQSEAEQCHDILSAFLETMLLRKIGRTVLETHKGDICTMVAVYTRLYLALPVDNMVRPRSECDCVRCKALNKYLEDPNLETKVFINVTLSRHQHLLQQVQMAHHRFTWTYRYGPADVLSGETRTRFPDTWSSELRKKRFPKPWTASKGYECTTSENDHVQELTVKKTSRAQEIFQARLYKAGKLEARIATSRLGVSLWDDARKLARSFDRIATSRSNKLAAAEAKAKQLIESLAQEVARSSTIVSATGLGISEERHASGISAKACHVPPIARIATPQSSSKVIALKGVNTKKDVASVLTAKTPTTIHSHKKQEVSSGRKGSFGASIAAQWAKAIFGSREGDSVTGRLPNGDKGSTQVPPSQNAEPGVQKQTPVSNDTYPKVATPSSKPQPCGEESSTTGAMSGSRTLRSASVSKRSSGTSQPTPARSSQWSKRIVANRKVIPDSKSDSDVDSHSDYESTQRLIKNVTSTTSASTGLISLNPCAALVKLGPNQSAQRCDVRELDQSATGHDHGYTSALRSLQQGVWKLRAEQVGIDLGSWVLLDDDFLLGLEKLSKSSNVSWEEALAVLKQVQKERKDEEIKRAVTSPKAWLPSDTTAALTRILTKTTEPRAAEPLEMKPPSTNTSPLSFLTPTPETQSTTPVVQSTTPPGDPPPNMTIFDSVVHFPTAVFERTSTEDEQPHQSHKPAALIASQKFAKEMIDPAAKPVNVGMRQSASVASSTSVPVREHVFGLEKPGRSKPSGMSLYEALFGTSSAAPTAPAATRLPVPIRPQNIVSGKASAADGAVRSHASTAPPIPSVQQVRVVDDIAKSHRSWAKPTEVITLDVDCENSEDSDGTRADTARLGATLTSTSSTTPRATSLSFLDPASRPRERITPRGRQAVSGSTDGFCDTLPGIDVILGRIAATTSSPQAPTSSTGSRATASRYGEESATTNSRYIAPHWNSSNAHPLDFTTRPRIIPFATLERFKNGGVSGTVATRSIHTAQNATSDSEAGKGRRTVTAPECPVVPTAQITTPSTSATKENGVARPESYIAAVPQTVPMPTNAGNKRSVDDAGLSLNGRPDSTRRKIDTAKVHDVIDLLDSDEEHVHMLPGHKKMPMAID